MPVGRSKAALKRALVRSNKAKKDKALKKFDYIEEQGHFGVSKVKCKCGQTLAELRPVPEMQKVERIKGKTIIHERVAMCTNASYTEIEITFDDGSKHITPTCRDCIRSGFNEDDLNRIYAADMARWADEEKRGMGKVNWALNADRLAVSFRELSAEERFK